MMPTDLAPKPKMAVASWSFHEEFNDPVVKPPFSPEEFMETCARDVQIPYVELLYTHLMHPVSPGETGEQSSVEHPTQDRLEAIRNRAEELGVKIVCLAVNNDFVSSGATERSADIEYVIECVERAHQLGAGLVRINAGISRCSGEVVATFIDSVKQVRDGSPHLQHTGPGSVRLVLENQGGITQDAYNLMDIMLRAESELGPNVLGVCLDTGNSTATDCVKCIKLLARTSLPCRMDVDPEQWTPSREKQRYAAQRLQTARLLSRSLDPSLQDPSWPRLELVDQSSLNKNFIAHVHAKSYSLNPLAPLCSLQTDYSHILWQLFLSRYDGYFSVEYEGQEGFSDGGPYEYEEEEPYTERTTFEARGPLGPRQRRQNTVDAIRNLRRLIMDTYRDYAQDMRGDTP